MKVKDNVVIIPLSDPNNLYRTQILKIDKNYLFLKFDEDKLPENEKNLILKFAVDGTMNQQEVQLKKINKEKKYFVVEIPEDKSADRQFARVETSIFCEFEIWNTGGKISSGNITNLSANGSVILSEVPSEKNKLVRILEIKDPKFNFKVDNVVGKIVKYKPTPLEGFNNELVLSFINLKKSKQDKIVKYVNEVIRSQS